MRRATKRVLMIITVMITTLGLLGAPAGADNYWSPTPDEGGGGEVHFLLFGCPNGSDLNIVIDGETVATTVSSGGLQNFVVTIPEGSPGNVLSVLCETPSGKTKIEGVNIYKGAGSCKWWNWYGKKKGKYSDRHNKMCLKITSAPGGWGGWGGWSWISSDGVSFDEAFSPVTITGDGTGVVFAAAAFEPASAVSIGGDSPPWALLQLAGAGVGLAAMGLFVDRRRRSLA